MDSPVRTRDSTVLYYGPLWPHYWPTRCCTGQALEAHNGRTK